MQAGERPGVLKRSLFAIDMMRGMSSRQIIHLVRNRVAGKRLRRIQKDRMWRNITCTRAVSIQRRRIESSDPSDLLRYISPRSVFPHTLPDDLKERLPEYHAALLSLFSNRISSEAIAESAARRWISPETSEEYCCFQRFALFERFLAARADAAQCVIDLIDAWIQTLPMQPLAAIDPMNVALRLINWTRLLQLIPPDIRLSNDFLTRLHLAIREQVTFLAGNLEHDVGCNHLLVELYAVWALTRSCPHLVPSRLTEEAVSTRLQAELSCQLSSSSFHCEQSSFYHLQTVLMALAWSSVDSGRHSTASQRIDSTISDAADRVHALLGRGKHLPLLGDSCYSFFTASIREDIELLEQLSGLHGYRPRATSRCEARPPYVSCQTERAHVVVSVGNIGYRPNPGHGHSDIASFILTLDSIPLFIDGGTLRYSNDRNSLSLKGSTRHNTLSVDGRDQARLWGFFRWAFLPHNVRSLHEHRNGSSRTIVTYTGFKKRRPLTHSRELVLCNDRVVVRDEVRSDYTVGSIEFACVVHPRWLVRQADGTGCLHICHGACQVTLMIDARLAVNYHPVTIGTQYGASMQATRISMAAAEPRLPATYETRIEFN